LYRDAAPNVHRAGRAGRRACIAAGPHRG